MLSDRAKKWMWASALNMFLAVALGAFGAHELKQWVAEDRISDIFDTGNDYHFYHALALGLVAWIVDRYPAKQIDWAGWCMLLGIVFFSGSLYVLTVKPDWSWLGPITPLGGLSFLLGWGLIVQIMWPFGQKR